MPPSRDSFGLALNALRARLRAAVDPPGAALPIHLIAGDLRLSPTPVREALSRLAGEELVEKLGPAYTRPLLDGPSLAELYGLRLLYLSAALAPGSGRAGGLRGWPARPTGDLAADLADPAVDASVLVEALFLEMMLRADDLMLAQAYQRAAERLAPFHAVEAALFEDRRSEALDLAGAFQSGQARGLRRTVRAFHRRRIAAAFAIARLAGGGKYRTDII